MANSTRGKSTAPAKKVWRISRSAPQGEWVLVEPSPPVKVAPVAKLTPVAKPRGDDLPEVSSGSWVTSSYDLLSGSEVTENPETIPDELFDELFAPRQDDPKNSGK
jgi:hypothetical protein